MPAARPPATGPTAARYTALALRRPGGDAAQNRDGPHRTPAFFTVVALAGAVGLSLDQITSRCSAADPDGARQRSA
jgi:hypothetical protein